MSLSRNDPAVGGVRTDVVLRALEVVLRERVDGVVAEDEVARLIVSDELEELLFVLGCVKDGSPRKLSCLLSVLGYGTIGDGDVGVGTWSIGMGVVVRFFVTFSDVVSPVV